MGKKNFFPSSYSSAPTPASSSPSLAYEIEMHAALHSKLVSLYEGIKWTSHQLQEDLQVLRNERIDNLECLEKALQRGHLKASALHKVAIDLLMDRLAITFERQFDGRERMLHEENSHVPIEIFDFLTNSDIYAMHAERIYNLQILLILSPSTWHTIKLAAGSKIRIEDTLQSPESLDRLVVEWKTRSTQAQVANLSLAVECSTDAIDAIPTDPSTTTGLLLPIVPMPSRLREGSGRRGEPFITPPSTTTATLPTLPQSRMSVRCADGMQYTVDRLCPHKQADLSRAEIEGNILICPKHRWKFDLSKGGICVEGKRPCTLNAIPEW